MALVVGIHGIAQQYRGGAQLREAWFPALQDGMTAAGYRSAAESLPRDELRVSFFGDFFRPRAALGGPPPVGAKDLTSHDEIALLSSLYAELVVQQPSLAPPKSALGPGLVAVQEMVERLLRSETLARASERLLVGSLKQVVAFLTDDDVKRDVLSRVNEDVDDGTQVLIGHSLGSVVAYEFICRYRPPNLSTLITLGSPLGIRNVIFDRLSPKPVAGKGIWPGAGADGTSRGVRSWVNVADPDDIVALRKDLDSLFAAPGQASVEDRLVDNGGQPHSVTRYLAAKEVGSAIADAL
jgi:hypothetical protein